MRTPRRVAAALTIGAVLLAVPDSAHTAPDVILVRVDTAAGVDHPRGMVWVLALGSDARPGENPLRTRADAIQLVGLDVAHHRAAVIGIPRDSWVSIPGVGFNRINAGLYYGGPDLMARTVSNLVGITPDYVMVTTFGGFKAMIRAVDGVTVDSRLAFTDDNMPGRIRTGRNRLGDAASLFFVRARHFLPRGDFDRSANQQEMLRAILRRARARQAEPGFVERGVLSVLRHISTDLSPSEMYRLASAVMTVDPARVRGCVVQGSIGYAGAASVVFPDTALARRLGDDARSDGRFDRGC